MDVSEEDANLAIYLGFSVNLILMNDPRYLLNILKLIARFPLDILSVLTDALAPCLIPIIREPLLASCKAAHEDEDEAAASVKLRSKLPTPIRHFVGMIFKHAQYEYIGYVYGWEVSFSIPREPVVDVRDDFFVAVLHGFRSVDRVNER